MKYKRGVSNKLFTDIQSDANNHTYRFSDMFKILQNNTLSRDMLCTEKTKVLNIHYGDVLIKYNAVTNIETTEIPYIKENIDLSKFSPISYLESGDVVFADTAEDYTVGKATEIQSENKVFILSGLHTIPCRPIINFHKGYLGHYFNSSAYRTDILPLIQGTKVSSISKTELLKTSVVVPPLEQQRKVAKLLSAFDNKITNLELEVAKLIKLKSGLLQQLFI